MSNDKLILGLAGDVMIGRGVDYALTREGYSYIWGNVLPILRSTDLNIVNLETALTKSHHKVLKTFNFKASPDKIKSLVEAKITIVNLANNHILDFSEEGLADTIQFLDFAGIKFVGAGKNENEASRAVIFSKNNISIGVLGFTDNESGWRAGSSTWGVNYIDVGIHKDRHRALQRIERLKSEADIVIVSIHWGPNLKKIPSRQFIDFAHQMIHSGASIIHGHSAHNFQGIEAYDHKIIFYDTGDFIDDYIVHPDLKNDHTFFYRLELDKTGITKAELIPVLISNCQVNLAAGDDYIWSLKRVQQLSSDFNTQINDKGEIVLTSVNRTSTSAIKYSQQ